MNLYNRKKVEDVETFINRMLGEAERIYDLRPLPREELLKEMAQWAEGRTVFGAELFSEEIIREGEARWVSVIELIGEKDSQSFSF